jgi:hypothetical protein
MRQSEFFWWLPPGGVSAATAWTHQWLALLAVVVVAPLLTLLIRDVHRAGGISPWITGMVPALKQVGELRDECAKRRLQRRLAKVNGRRRLRALRKRK